MWTSSIFVPSVAKLAAAVARAEKARFRAMRTARGVAAAVWRPSVRGVKVAAVAAWRPVKPKARPVALAADPLNRRPKRVAAAPRLKRHVTPVAAVALALAVLVKIYPNLVGLSETAGFRGASHDI